jgi:cytochrome c-type biogenesis protein CcmH/NrfG
MLKLVARTEPLKTRAQSYLAGKLHSRPKFSEAATTLLVMFR